MLKTSLGRFRLVALAEGTSYILLLAVAMPLKYALDMPMMVKIVGRIHGGLTILFVFALLAVALTQRWSIVKSVVAFLSSLIPLGAFFFEARIKDEVPAEHAPGE